MRAGDVIGERAVISGRPRAASVSATTDGQVLRINADSFRSLLADCPRFAVAVKERDAARERRVGGNVPLDFNGELTEPDRETPTAAEDRRPTGDPSSGRCSEAGRCPSCGSSMRPTVQSPLSHP